MPLNYPEEHIPGLSTATLGSVTSFRRASPGTGTIQTLKRTAGTFSSRFRIEFTISLESIRQHLGEKQACLADVLFAIAIHAGELQNSVALARLGLRP